MLQVLDGGLLPLSSQPVGPPTLQAVDANPDQHGLQEQADIELQPSGYDHPHNDWQQQQQQWLPGPMTWESPASGACQLQQLGYDPVLWQQLQWPPVPYHLQQHWQSQPQQHLVAMPQPSVLCTQSAEPTAAQVSDTSQAAAATAAEAPPRPPAAAADAEGGSRSVAAAAGAAVTVVTGPQEPSHEAHTAAAAAGPTAATTAAASSRVAATTAFQSGAAVAAVGPAIPSTVDVTCGAVHGVFDVSRYVVAPCGGHEPV